LLPEASIGVNHSYLKRNKPSLEYQPVGPLPPHQRWEGKNQETNTTRLSSFDLRQTPWKPPPGGGPLEDRRARTFLRRAPHAPTPQRDVKRCVCWEQH
jgi:hypothetical protein